MVPPLRGDGESDVSPGPFPAGKGSDGGGFRRGGGRWGAWIAASARNDGLYVSGGW